MALVRPSPCFIPLYACVCDDLHSQSLTRANHVPLCPDTVCYAMACSPCAYGDMAAIAPANSIMFAGNCCMAGCCFMAMPQLFLCAAHQGLRTAFNIDGSCIGDCFAGCFCPLCALLQQSRECQIRNAAPNGGMQANPMVMVAAPQQVMMQQPVMMVQQPQVVMQPQVMYVR